MNKKHNRLAGLTLIIFLLMLINISCNKKSDSHIRNNDTTSEMVMETQSDSITGSNDSASEERIERQSESDGVYAEFVTKEGRKYTLKTDSTVAELSGDAAWWKKDGAIVVFTGEGTSHWTLLDGYLYEGYYEDGQCWQEEWVGGEEGGPEGGLEDVGYIPKPSRGEKLKSLKIYR